MNFGILAYLIIVGAVVVAAFLLMSVVAFIFWIRDTIHYRSIHHTIATGGRHRGDDSTQHRE